MQRSALMKVKSRHGDDPSAKEPQVAKVKHGRTPFSYGAEDENNTTVAHMPGTEGVSVDEKDHLDKTSLLRAVRRGDSSSIPLLVSAGVSINEKDEKGRTLLAYAVAHGDRSSVDLLISAGASVEEKDESGRTPFVYAASRGDTLIMQLLISAGASCDEKDKRERTPLHYAAASEESSSVQLLISGRAAVDTKDDEGRTPLSYAARYGESSSIPILISAGALVNESCLWGRAPLSYAAERGDISIMQLLISARALVDLKDRQNRTPLSYASEREDSASVQLLLSHGASVNGKDRERRTPLLYACKCGDSSSVQLLISAGASVNEKDSDGRTPLSYAAQRGVSSSITVLISAGADVNIKDESVRTPLSYAAASGDNASIQLLISAGASVDQRDKAKRSPLSYAAARGDSSSMQLLISAGVSVDEKDRRGRTLLSYAAESSGNSNMQLILSLGASVYEKDSHGRTPLSYAAERGDNSSIKKLIAAGAPVDEADEGGRTPLSYAAASGANSNIQLLISAGASVNKKDEGGRTPLSHAAARENSSSVQILISAGASVDEKDEDGRTPLSYAAARGDNLSVQLLIASGASVDEKDKDGKTPLWHAYRHDDNSSVQLLISNGASVDEKDERRKTLLFLAAERGDSATVQLLISAGAFVNAKDEVGRSSLFYAAAHGDILSVERLISAGASVDEKDLWGETPLMYAARYGANSNIKELISAGASVNAKDSHGSTPLSHAAERGDNSSIKKLIAAGAPVDEADEGGRTPLSYAAASGANSNIQLLISAGASVNKKDEGGRTPLSHAAARENSSSVQILISAGASVDEKDEDGRTPLSYAAEDGDSLSIALLISSGASVDEKDKDGRAPLWYAVKRQDHAKINDLIDSGAALDEKDNEGKTSLWYATQSQAHSVIAQLIKAGASPNETTIQTGSEHDCETCLTLAGRTGDMKSFKLLIEAAASVNVRAADGETPLISLARWDYASGVQLLVQSGTSLFSHAMSGCETPLLSGSLTTMRELCEAPYEFDQVLCGVAQRLETICSLLETGLMDCSPDVITTFTTIVFRFCRLLFQLEKSASVLSRFIISTTYLHNVREFHEELDHFAELQNLVQHVGSWNDQWTQAETSAYQRMYEQLQTDKYLLHGLKTYKDKYKVLVRLDYEIRKLRRGTNDPTVVRNFEQVATRLAVICKIEAPRAPVWFIPFEAVERDKETGTGKWANIQVTIFPVYESKEYFFQEKASRWYQLSHPNVQKLFGACHISRPQFFVCEYAVSVLDALESQNDDRQLMWKYLLDAALGVQYLHQRGIVHGDLRCDNIVIGSDQKAKIRALFDKVDHSMFITDSLWTSPEIRVSQPKRSLASDIYALGMCIVEAATPKQDRSIMRPIRLKYIRPRSFSDAEWDLVTKMCASEPAERVRIVYVVHQLKQIATNDFLSRSADQGSSKVRNEIELETIEDNKFPDLAGRTIPKTLKNIQKRCIQFPKSPWMIANVYPALEFAFARLKLLQKRPSDVEVQAFCECLSKFERYLQTTKSEESIARAARSRQVAESHYVIYEKLDRLLNWLSVDDNDSIRQWKRSPASIDGRILGNNSSAIGNQTEEGDKKNEAVTLIRFASPDNVVKSGSTALPLWYLPFRELTFSESDKLGQGASGVVCKGVWLDTPVVVKFIKSENDGGTTSTKLFLHEVETWYRMNHPQVVKLHGACHIDKRYFVCEYAPNGNLSAFLKQDGNGHLVWEKLYQAALGLAYVHSLNIAHNDLKCDNILIGMDGTAKLIDFGLSAVLDEAEVMVDMKNMGAVNWKSPEYLAGKRPTLASDVYSFAMCILEAVTGTHPWGKKVSREFVQRKLKMGQIPNRPAFMSDKQWNLVELMTKMDPSKRVNMSYVANKLFEISEFEKSERTAVVP